MGVNIPLDMKKLKACHKEALEPTLDEIIHNPKGFIIEAPVIRTSNA